MNKDIEVILNEMIELCLKQGRKPLEFWLSGEDYKRLQEKFKKVEGRGYKIDGDFIRYYKKPIFHYPEIKS